MHNYDYHLIGVFIIQALINKQMQTSVWIMHY